MMQTSLQSYYLQQMGIETWVRRNQRPRASAVHLIAPKRAESSALVLFEGGAFDKAGQWIEGAAGRLLQNMLQSIGLSLDNTAVLFGDPEQMGDVVESHVVHLKPCVILVLDQTNQLSVGLRLKSLNQPYISCTHPLNLLKQPSQKKSAYATLLQIKTKLPQELSVMS